MDALAKMALVNDEVLRKFDDPPSEIQVLLEEDRIRDILNMGISL